MAKLMNTTRRDGSAVTNAYYIPNDRNFTKRTKTGSIVFQAWINKASSKDLTKSPIEGADIRFSVNPTEYDKYFSDAVMAEDGVSIGAQCYRYADEKKEIDSGEKDEDGNPVMVSKFATATDDL